MGAEYKSAEEIKASKPIHVKPIFYAYCFERLKTIAKDCGYNLTLHGSMNRDLDLIAIPWTKEVKHHSEMIRLFVEEVGGSIMRQIWVNGELHEAQAGELFTVTHHGRMWYVINLKRNYTDEHGKYEEDKQYYLDISVMPTLTDNASQFKTEVKDEEQEELWSKVVSRAFDEFGHTMFSLEAVKSFISEMQQHYSIKKKT